MSRALKGLRAIRHLRGPQTKAVPQILRELVVAAAADRSVPLHYFSHLLYKRGSPDVGAFVGYRAFGRIRAGLLMPAGRPNACLEDKLHFARHLSAHGIAQPRLLRFTMNEQVFTPGGQPRERLDDTAPSWLRDLIAQTATGAIFVKPIAGTGGRGCTRVDPTTPDARMRTLSRAWRRGNHLIQEALDQHPVMAAIHPESVNTLRVHTFRHPDGSVTLLSALVRFGGGGRAVDNVTSGGMYAGLDLATGQVSPTAQTFVVHGGAQFSAHPGTGVVFATVRLPLMAEVAGLVRSVAAVFPDPVVGWDVALTAAGPVIVEGNDDPHLTMAQVACGGFRTSARWWPVLAPCLGEG